MRKTDSWCTSLEFGAGISFCFFYTSIHSLAKAQLAWIKCSEARLGHAWTAVLTHLSYFCTLEIGEIMDLHFCQTLGVATTTDDWPLECERRWQPGSRCQGAWSSLSLPLYVHTNRQKQKQTSAAAASHHLWNVESSLEGWQLAFSCEFSHPVFPLFTNHSFFTPFLCPWRHG